MLDRLKNIILDYVELDPEELTAETSLRGDLGLNSFILINLITAIEDEFNVEISEKSIKDISTLRDLAGYLEAQNASAAG